MSFIISPGKYFKFSEHVSYKVEKPSMPMATKLGAINDTLKIEDAEREIILDHIRWILDPYFPSRGRSAFLERNQPLVTDKDTVAAYKLKGVGNYNKEANTVHPPRLNQYEKKMALPGARSLMGKILAEVPAVLIHMGFTDKGLPYPVLDTPKPLGGLSAGHGEREFKNTLHLNNAGVPVCTPVLWGQYPEIAWEGKPLEFVVLGQPSTDPHRMGDYFEQEAADGKRAFTTLMKAAIAKQFDFYDEKKTGLPAIKVARDMGYNIGKILRAAHDAGLARFAGHTGNFSYIPAKKTAYMHDLDSSISLEDLAPQAQAMTLIRDIESALFGIFYSIIYSRFYWLIGNDEHFQKNHPIRALLQGYFKEIPHETLVNHVSVKTIEKIVSEFITLYGKEPSYQHQNEWMQLAQNTFISKVMEQIMKLYQSSTLVEKFPLPYKPKEFESHLNKFGRERDELFQKEMERILNKHPHLREYFIR